jgi:hypothetical protein
MNKQPDFLLDKVLRHDLVLVHVTGAPRPQVLRAKIGRIYSTGEGVVRSFLNSEVEFIRSGGTWGDVALKVYEQALLFVKSILESCMRILGMGIWLWRILRGIYMQSILARNCG